MRRLVHPRWRSTRPSRLLALVFVVSAAASACTAGSTSSQAPSSQAPSSPSDSSPTQTGSTRDVRSNPAVDGNGGVQNVTFYYQGTTPLETGQDLSKLGKPAVVVTTPKPDEEEAVKAIHATGALAYRYAQFYWVPTDSSYEGVDLSKHPDWAFCGKGGKPLLGRVTDPGHEEWQFLDANEKTVRASFRKTLAGFKADGWDGVFFDRGEAATQYAKDVHGHPVWDERSTCTDHPFKPGARFADAYVNMVGLAHAVGLQAMMNSGKSPFDPVVPMRPDPADPRCRAREWGMCTFLSDPWSKLNLVLSERATAPKDEWWHRAFVGNQRSERSAAHGRRTVALITTATLGGRSGQTRSAVFYQWSRIKLFDLPVAVNTGDGGCPKGLGDVCNHYGIYGELVNTLFGRPLGDIPVAQDCVGSSKVHCVWVRRYAQGINVLNASAQGRTRTRIGLGTSSCRYVYDVFHRKPVADNRCVRSVRLDLPSWSGRPLKYSTSPW